MPFVSVSFVPQIGAFIPNHSYQFPTLITSDSRQPRTGSDELLKASCQGNFLILTHLSWIHHPEFLTTWVDHVADWLRPRDLTKVLAGECVQRHVATVIHQPQVLGANLLNISNLIRRR